MPNLNQVNLIGHLTRSPELRRTPKGTAVADLGLAINHVWKDDSGKKNEKVVFVEIELWGRTAEVASEYLRKGSPCFIGGRLELEEWTDKPTGAKRQKIKVVGEILQLLGSKPGGSEQEPAA